MCTRRIACEVKMCLKRGTFMYSLDNSGCRYTTFILGPWIDSPYLDGLFALNIEYPQDYPSKPMQVQFITPVYHPNISASGEVSLDILGNRWSPGFTLYSVLLSISSLLNDPSYENPLNLEAADLYRRDPQQYDEKSRQYTRLHAI